MYGFMIRVRGLGDQVAVLYGFRMGATGFGPGG